MASEFQPRENRSATWNGFARWRIEIREESRRISGRRSATGFPNDSETEKSRGIIVPSDPISRQDNSFL